MTKAPSRKKPQPRLITSSLTKGNTSEVAIGPRPRWASAVTAMMAMSASASSRVRPAKPALLCRVTFR
jgi:hypothetical protein